MDFFFLPAFCRITGGTLLVCSVYFFWGTQKHSQTGTRYHLLLNSRYGVKIVLTECPPVEIVQLNWAELRQMRCSKLNKQSSLLGDSTMVIRVSCELPYIIYGGAVGRLQLNKPTAH